MSPGAVLDTHALVWWLTEPRRLSARAKRVAQSASPERPLMVSAASVLEIATLVRRGRLQLALGLEAWLEDARSLPELKFEPVSADIASTAGSMPDAVPGDPIDRLIAATALRARVALVSADRRLREVPDLRVIW